MTRLTEESLDNPLALVGHTKALFGEKLVKNLPCFLIRVTHSPNIIGLIKLSSKIDWVKLNGTKYGLMQKRLFLLGIKNK